MSNSSREEGESSFKSMDNGNGYRALPIEAHPALEHDKTNKKSPKCSYHECQKNHAAAINGNARDGCGEFMAGGDEGTLEALNCAACYCHRNFHRKQIVEEEEIEVHEQPIVGYPTDMQMMVPSARVGMMRRKRSRTKFTKEQKQKMRHFALNAGWKLQMIEDSVVQRFCQEIGINRKVLKVWMQNNKHVYMGINKNKNNNSSSSNQI